MRLLQYFDIIIDSFVLSQILNLDQNTCKKLKTEIKIRLSYENYDQTQILACFFGLLLK